MASPDAIVKNLCGVMAHGLAFPAPLARALGIKTKPAGSNSSWLVGAAIRFYDCRLSHLLVAFMRGIVVLHHCAAVFDGWPERAGLHKASVAASC